MEKKTGSIRARIPEGLRERLEAIHKRHLTNDTVLTVNALEALCDYIEANDKVAFPVKMVAADLKPSENKRRAS